MFTIVYVTRESGENEDVFFSTILPRSWVNKETAEGYANLLVTNWDYIETADVIEIGG